MARINRRLQAKDNLRNIADCISKDSVVHAKCLVLRINNKTNILKKQIRIRKIVPEI